MRKYALLLVTMIVIMINTVFAFASAAEWECPNCHTVVTGNFCSNCGTAKPEWKCPECGEQATGNYCWNCAARKPWYMSSVETGDCITFGQYEQDNNEDNGSEPVEWSVVAKEDDKALIISKYALDSRPYHDTLTTVNWATSDLRSWLNNTFYEEVFSSAEKELIEEAAVPAEDNLVFELDAGNTTRDKVFLLSINETEQYFPVEADRACEATAYAEEHRAFVNTENGMCYWWLRSLGRDYYDAVRVNHDGSIGYGGYDVDYNYICVRPALWINLSSEKMNALIVNMENEQETSPAGDWHNNQLKEDHGIIGELKENKQATKPADNLFGVDAWKRDQIRAVFVLDTLENMPADAVDLSASGNGSVMGWVDKDQALYIAGNGGVKAPEDCTALFACLVNATTIDFGGNFHTDETTKMGYMFGKCRILSNLNMEGMVTDNVTTFTRMFGGCRGFKTIDFHGFHTQNVKSFFGMFFNCRTLEYLDLSSFDTFNGEDFRIMFRGCTNLREIKWNPQTFSTAKATSLIQMFMDCTSLEKVDVSMLDTSNVTNMYMMFSGCESLSELDASGWDMSKAEAHRDMFAGTPLEIPLGRHGEALF